jgi:hypothetical protein
MWTDSETLATLGGRLYSMMLMLALSFFHHARLEVLSAALANVDITRMREVGPAAVCEPHFCLIVTCK